jgi:transposase-like protein
MSNAEAARELGAAVKSVSKWRRQFADQRLAGLEDAAPVGRRSAPLVLDEAERAQLIRWARRAKTAQFLALRAKIVLRGGRDEPGGRRGPGEDKSTVERWRARFVARRLEGLHDEPRGPAWRAQRHHERQPGLGQPRTRPDRRRRSPPPLPRT